MENYICINGKKAELTEEQMKTLGIEVSKKSPFEFVNGDYYFINATGRVEMDYCCEGCLTTLDRNDVANYCTDKAIMEQRALHETLNRLLWRYSMEHDGDKIDWKNDDESKFYVAYDHRREEIYISGSKFLNKLGCPYFNQREIAQSAVEEIIKPFMVAHPDFKW